MIYIFAEKPHCRKPLVRMTHCRDRDQATALEGVTAIHEIEAATEHTAMCKLVAQHPARECDIRFYRA